MAGQKPAQTGTYTHDYNAPEITMAGQKPTGAMVTSVIGGLFIMLGGIALLYLGAFLGAFLSGMMIVPLGPDPVAILNTLGILGVVLGLAVAALGIVMFVKPGWSKVLGAVVLVLSLASIVSFGGFIFGLILGVVGGILGILFKPTPPMAPYATPAVPPAQ